MKKIFYLILTFLFGLVAASGAHAQIINTIVGNDAVTSSFADSILAVDAAIYPISIAVDHGGNLYISDRDYTNRIRKVAAGIIYTIAGNDTAGYSGDGGLAKLAELNQPAGIAIDSIGNIYVCDVNNYRVRKIDTSGIITTIAGNGSAGFAGDGGQATAASIGPWNIAIDGSGNLYITDIGNERIRMVNSAGIITTIAGNGAHGYNGDGIAATLAALNYPRAAIPDGNGNLYIADGANHRVRKVNALGIITSIAGNDTAGYSGDGGLATNAKLQFPYSIAIDATGNIYFTDAGLNSTLRKIDQEGIIGTIAGTGTYGFSGDGGIATLAEMNQPTDVVIDKDGSIYIDDAGNGRIRYIRQSELVRNQITVNPAITLYPNPSSGNFTVIISSTLQEQGKVIITNLLGKEIKEMNTVTNEPVNVILNAPAGIYFVSVITANGVCNKEIVVNK